MLQSKRINFLVNMNVEKKNYENYTPKTLRLLIKSTRYINIKGIY